MKHRLAIAALILGFSSVAAAQDGPTAPLTEFPGALLTLVNGGQGALVTLLDGNVTGFFDQGRNSLNGFYFEVLGDTPGEPLAELLAGINDTGFDALLPLYLALDGPAMRLADLGSPLLDPLQSLLGVGLPLDAFSPGALTQLLSGASLEGLEL